MATVERISILNYLAGPRPLQVGSLVYEPLSDTYFKLKAGFSIPPLDSDWEAFGTGGGDVFGPGSSTDNAIVRWDGAGGFTLQNSTAILSDAGVLTGITDFSLTGFQDFTGEAAPALSAVGHGRIYFDSGSNTWKISQSGGAYVDVIGGGGDVFGPAGATDNAVVRFDSATGKLIQNSVVIIGDTGITTGVLDLSQTGFHDFTEEAAPSISALGHSRLYADSTSHTFKLSENNGAYFNVGDVRGPGSSTDNAFVRFDSTTGKIIQNSVVIADDSGNVSGIVNLSITGFEDWTEEAAPALSAAGHGRIYVDSTTHLFNVSENGGAYVPLVTITAGFVVGPGSATDNAVTRFDGTTGKLVQDSTVLIGDTGIVTGVLDLFQTGFHDLTEEVAPALSAVGHSRLYADSTSHTLKLSENGGAYVNVITDTSTFVVGPGSATDTAVALYNGTTGKIIKNSSVLIDGSGNVTGVVNFSQTGFHDYTEEAAPALSAAGHGRIYVDSITHLFNVSENGGAYVPLVTVTTGFVVGPGSATDNAVSRFDSTTGKLIQNSGVIIDDSNNVSGIGSLSITTFEDWTESAAPSVSASGHGRMYIDSTSHVFRLSENNGAYFTIGDVRGPASATDNAVTRFDATTGKLIQNSVVIIDDTGNTSGIPNLSITGFEDWTEEAAPALSAAGHGRIYVDSTTHLFNVSENGGAYVPLVTVTSGFVVGPGSATDNAVSRFDGTTGKLIQNSVVIIGDTGVVTGVTDFSQTGFHDFTEEAAPAASAAGHSRLYADSTSHTLKLSENAGSYFNVGSVRGPATSTSTAFPRWNGTTGFILQDSGVLCDGSNNVSGIGSLSIGTFEDWTESVAPAVSAAGHGRMYIDSTSHVFRLSENNGSYFTIGDVRGPASATDNAVSRFDLTTGKLIQNSGVIIDDSNNVTGVVNFSQTGFQDYTEMAAPAVSAASHTRVYADSTSHTFKFSENAGSYFDFGNVRGPASATDNAIARFDLTTGKLIQNSGVTIDDSNNLAGIGSLSITSLTITGSITLPYTASAAGNYTVLTTDYYIGKTGITGGGDTVTLPAPAAGKAFVIHDESGTAATNNITVNVTAAGTIDGQATIVITANYGTLRVFSNASTYDSW